MLQVTLGTGASRDAPVSPRAAVTAWVLRCVVCKWASSPRTVPHRLQPLRGTALRLARKTRPQGCPWPAPARVCSQSCPRRPLAEGSAPFCPW